MSEKNVETKEISVEERLQALYNLQMVVSEIDKIRTIRGELPLEVQDLEDEVAGLKTRIEKYHYAYGLWPDKYQYPHPYSIHEYFNKETLELFERAFTKEKVQELFKKMEVYSQEGKKKYNEAFLKLRSFQVYQQFLQVLKQTFRN